MEGVSPRMPNSPHHLSGVVQYWTLQRGGGVRRGRAERGREGGERCAHEVREVWGGGGEGGGGSVGAGGLARQAGVSPFQGEASHRSEF